MLSPVNYIIYTSVVLSRFIHQSPILCSGSSSSRPNLSCSYVSLLDSHWSYIQEIYIQYLVLFLQDLFSWFLMLLLVFGAIFVFLWISVEALHCCILRYDSKSAYSLNFRDICCLIECSLYHFKWIQWNTLLELESELIDIWSLNWFQYMCHLFEVSEVIEMFALFWKIYLDVIWSDKVIFRTK